MDKELLKYMNEVAAYYTGKESNYSAQDIVNMFLETPKKEKGNSFQTQAVIKENAVSSYTLDFDELNKWKNKNNSKYEVRSHLPITSHRKFIGKLLIGGKKTVRKFLKWYINPIVEQQNEFNGSVTASINALSNNDIVFNQYMQEQLSNGQGTWQEVQNLGSKVEEIKAQLDEINSSNREAEWIQEQINSLKQEIINNQEKYEKDIQGLEDQIMQQNLAYAESISNLETKIINSLKQHGEEQLATLREEFNDKLMKYNQSHNNEISLMNEETERIQENINYLTYKLNKAKKEGIKVELLKIKEDESDVEIKEDGLDYFLFENKFRGTEKSVKKNQEQYISYYKEKENILDIGCGRGEFLELLQDNNITAQGIDVYEEFVEYCKDKGMNAKLADALTYVKEQQDNSLGGIFMGQVAEHLEPDYLLNLLRCCYEKVKKGCYFIAETPNPTNLTTFTNSFYLDPTHIKPVHPQTFKFMLEYVGFKQVEIVYTENSKPNYRLPLLNIVGSENLEEFNSGINCMTDVLFGSLDYAVIAQK